MKITTLAMSTSTGVVPTNLETIRAKPGFKTIAFWRAQGMTGPPLPPDHCMNPFDLIKHFVMKTTDNLDWSAHNDWLHQLQHEVTFIHHVCSSWKCHIMCICEIDNCEIKSTWQLNSTSVDYYRSIYNYIHDFNNIIKWTLIFSQDLIHWLYVIHIYVICTIHSAVNWYWCVLVLCVYKAKGSWYFKDICKDLLQF